MPFRPWTKSDQPQSSEREPVLPPRSHSRQEYTAYTSYHLHAQSDYDPYRNNNPSHTKPNERLRARGVEAPLVTLLVSDHVLEPSKSELLASPNTPSSPTSGSQDIKKSLRSKFGIGHRPREEIEGREADSVGKLGFGRSRSLRKKESLANPHYLQEPLSAPVFAYKPFSQAAASGLHAERSELTISSSASSQQPSLTSSPYTAAPYCEDIFSSTLSSSNEPVHQRYSSSLPREPLVSLASLSQDNPASSNSQLYHQLKGISSRPSSRQRHSNSNLETDKPSETQIYELSAVNPSPPPTVLRSGQELGEMALQNSPRPQRQTQAADLTKPTPVPVIHEISNLQPPGETQESNRPLMPALSPNLSGRPQSAQRGQPLFSHDGDPGRGTPPPMRAANDLSEQEVSQLMEDYRELREKYSKVKRFYFQKEDQVKQLQNILAHQRLSQSRTSWDDGEYVSRLTRLDGLIAQLAYGFRKDWKIVPQWLQPHVNKDAVSVGKQEMTAVGRAFISRWLADEVFDRYFHPSLDVTVSEELKAVQKNVRQFSPVHQPGEEEDALAAKLVNWRLTTMDGLQQVISGPEAAARTLSLIDFLVKRLVTAIVEYMSDPLPAGIEGGVHMIVELAVSILSHLPLESREVQIEYFMPGTAVSPDLTKLEAGIPPLSNPIVAIEVVEGRRVSVSSDVSDKREHSADSKDEEVTEASKEHEQPRKGFFGGLIGGKKPPAAVQNQKQGSATASQTSLVPPPGFTGGGVSGKEDTQQRVRMCVFLGLQIRGKMVLLKAPVFRL